MQEQADLGHWDAIVVGSGPGGLTTAACLGSAGKRVLVLERHDVAGGNTQVFRRHHGDDWYEFDVGVHYIGECGPGGFLSRFFHSLGVGERIAFAPLDPDGFDTLVFPDFTFRVPAGWNDYQLRLTEQFPDDRDGIEQCLATLREVGREARLIFGEDRPTYDRWAMRPLAELFDDCGLSIEAAAVLDHWSGLYGSGPTNSSVAMHAAMIYHYMFGAAYPVGGGQMIAARLIQVIESQGGEVRTLAGVERILTADGAVTGVQLENGDIEHAPLVVSNADHRRTVLDLVGAEHLDPATVAWAQDAQMALGMLCVYAVVDIELDGPNTNYFVFPDYELDSLYDQLDRGEFPEEKLPFVYVAMASRKDPGNVELCPPGHTNFQIMTLAPRGYEFWGLDTGPADGGRYRRDPAYLARKQEVTDRLVDAAESVLGPFREHLVHLETATTLSYERYTHGSGGTSYGYEHSPEQSAAKRPSYRTEVDGLWLVGANTVSGHGIAGAISGGVFCAGEILDRPLIAEVALGEQLVDPSSIPPDPADFDPLEFSRGARLRAQRAERTASRRARRVRSG